MRPRCRPGTEIPVWGWRTNAAKDYQPTSEHTPMLRLADNPKRPKAHRDTVKIISVPFPTIRSRFCQAISPSSLNIAGPAKSPGQRSAALPCVWVNGRINRLQSVRTVANPAHFDFASPPHPSPRAVRFARAGSGGSPRATTMLDSGNVTKMRRCDGLLPVVTFPTGFVLGFCADPSFQTVWVKPL